ncbi:hypothetical protein K1719_006969 [Acacia pycnantha]|nr:hypothetical protein K1719_006969 [Acacia pycnantha]
MEELRPTSFDLNIVSGKILNSVRQARMYLVDLLLAGIHHIIYFDSNMILMDDVAKLWNINLGEHVLGVMVIDLWKWKEGRYTEKLET